MRTHYEPLADIPRCDHGERTDRTTSEGTPLCALCRIAERQKIRIDPNRIDYAALAAADDTWDDDEPAPDSGGHTEIVIAHLFAQNSGSRVSAMLDRWRDREPAGMLF